MGKNVEKKGRKKIFKRVLTAMLITPVIALILAISAVAIILHTGDEQVDPNKLTNEAINMVLTDIKGECVDLPEKYDNYADSKEIPERLKTAFVTLEDKRFYSHHGVDYLRIGKALINNLAAGGAKEGASTITQQLIKNTHLTSEKSIERKIEEARLAIKLEKMYSKDEILTMYLNMLYFGSGEYGVKNAARRFFGKELSELHIAECAMLAGIIKSPTKYNPINHPDNAKERMLLVLKIMKEEGAIDEEEYISAKNFHIITKNKINKSNLENNFLEYSIEECVKILNITPEQLLVNNFRVQTYLDKSAQKTLNSVMNSTALTLNTIGGNRPNSAAIVVDNVTCGIKAFYSDGSYTPKTLRQPGSTLKPLVCYAPALENGVIYPASIVKDEKKSFYGYSPDNYKDIYYGDISIRKALMYSLNVPAVEVMTMVGVERACSYLPKMGIILSESDYNYATALGGMTYGTNIVNLAGAYSCLACGGVYRPVSFIKEIKDRSGKTVYKHEPADVRVFGADTAYLITDMLMDTAKDGSAKKLSAIKYQIASKTGTVSATDPEYNTDAYNVSYTSRETAVFWQGNISGSVEDMLPSSVTGGGSPTLQAKNYFLQSDAEPVDFAVPSSVREMSMDRYDYEGGKVVLADSRAPERAVTKELFSLRHLPVKNTSYTLLSAPKYSITSLGAMFTVTMNLDPRLSYKVVKNDYFGGDSILYECRGGENTCVFNERYTQNTFFPPRYSICVSYIADDGKMHNARSYPLNLLR